MLLRLERGSKDGGQNPQQKEDHVVNYKAGEYWIPISHIDLETAEAQHNKNLILESIRRPNRRGISFNPRKFQLDVASSVSLHKDTEWELPVLV